MGFSWPRLFLTPDPAGPDPGSPKIESRIHECHPTINIAPTPQCQLLVSADTHPAHRPKDRQTGPVTAPPDTVTKRQKGTRDRPTQRHDREGGQGKGRQTQPYSGIYVGGKQKSNINKDMMHAHTYTHTHTHADSFINRSASHLCR